MEAQKLITMSINKITGSRKQRGGINLRKNLLVASVLHTARMHYYEEMCNRMPGNISLEHSQQESKMDDNETESPDWENDHELEEEEEEVSVDEEERSDESSTSVEDSACDRVACRVVVEPLLPVACELTPTSDCDKENVDPSSGHTPSSYAKHGHENYEYSYNNSCSITTSECERITLGEHHQNTSTNSVETCTTTTCLVIPSIKRKRTDRDNEEACDSLVAPSGCKRVKVDSQCQTMSTADCGAQSSISSLVDIFKAGFHGLAGESGGKLTQSVTTYDENDSSSSTPSYTTLTTPSRPFETLQAAVIAAC